MDGRVGTSAKTIIKRERLVRLMTQAEIGNVLGISNRTISLTESRRFAPSANYRRRFAEFYGLREDELFDEEGFARKFQ